mmetsp:Transcript_159972/g.513265  ORF Transcript_159972/g.513265 Transcript_159972/m.513265 type:complete len:566 (+) Transcript_159972:104-1801(+)
MPRRGSKISGQAPCRRDVLLFLLVAAVGGTLLVWDWQRSSTWDTLSHISGRREAVLQEQSQGTEVACKDRPGFNQTCLFRRILVSPQRELIVLAVGNVVVPDIRLVIWGGPLPVNEKTVIQRFDNESHLQSYLNALKPERHSGLVLWFGEYYHNNWAHAIWDSLYPAFVALAKFGRHADRFLPFLDIRDRNWNMTCSSPPSPSDPMACAMEDAFRLFASLGDPAGQTVKVHEVTKAGRWTFFDELLVGSGHVGQYSSILELPASLSFPYLPADPSILRRFVDRLFTTQGLEPPKTRSRSDAGRPEGSTIRVAITKNKRFSKELNEALLSTARITNVTQPGVIMDMVDWGTLRPFRKQLEFVRDVDIHVSSIGTALFFSLLMPDGAVTVNLGDLRFRKDGGIVPDYGEEFLGASSRMARQLFVPLSTIRTGVNTGDIMTLVREAVEMIRGGFTAATFHIEDNLSEFGKIIFSLLQRSDATRRALEGLSSDGKWGFKDNFNCPHRFPSALVLEQPADKMVHCRMNTKILRELKRDAGLQEILGYPDGCDCVVCDACQGPPVQDAQAR